MNDETNRLINDFCKEVDNQTTLEVDINTFARKIASLLAKNISDPTKIVEDDFYNEYFSFNIEQKMDRNNHYILVIRMYNAKQAPNSSKIWTPNVFYNNDKPRIWRSDLEYLPEYPLEEQLHKAVVMLMFTKYDFPLRPEEEN